MRTKVKEPEIVEIFFKDKKIQRKSKELYELLKSIPEKKFEEFPI